MDVWGNSLFKNDIINAFYEISPHLDMAEDAWVAVDVPLRV